MRDLKRAIHEYLAENNTHPKPFVWTASVDKILAKVNRCKPEFAANGSLHRLASEAQRAYPLKSRRTTVAALRPGSPLTYPPG